MGEEGEKEGLESFFLSILLPWVGGGGGEKVLPLPFAPVRPLTDEREDEHGRKGERKKVREGKKVCGVGFSSKYG